jgi:hypothetical protein
MLVAGMEVVVTCINRFNDQFLMQSLTQHLSHNCPWDLVFIQVQTLEPSCLLDRLPDLVELEDGPVADGSVVEACVLDEFAMEDACNPLVALQLIFRDAVQGDHHVFELLGGLFLGFDVALLV